MGMPEPEAMPEFVDQGSQKRLGSDLGIGDCDVAVVDDMNVLFIRRSIAFILTDEIWCRYRCHCLRLLFVDDDRKVFIIFVESCSSVLANLELDIGGLDAIPGVNRFA